MKSRMSGRGRDASGGAQLVGIQRVLRGGNDDVGVWVQAPINPLEQGAVAAVVVKDNQAQRVRGGNGIALRVVRGDNIVAGRGGQIIRDQYLQGIGGCQQGDVGVEIGRFRAIGGTMGIDHVRDNGHQIGDALADNVIIADQQGVGCKIRVQYIRDRENVRLHVN